MIFCLGDTERKRERERQEQDHALKSSLHAWIQTVDTENYRKQQQSHKPASR